jgi:hypothetical protein
MGGYVDGAYVSGRSTLAGNQLCMTPGQRLAFSRSSGAFEDGEICDVPRLGEVLETHAGGRRNSGWKASSQRQGPGTPRTRLARMKPDAKPPVRGQSH